ncbi:MAG TPA: HEAT repeat domain-containing protein [Gemmatimonadaceae bacterium]|nr:HEAT repeat domain-containing protein [Vicinamibacterales bacterium]
MKRFSIVVFATLLLPASAGAQPFTAGVVPPVPAAVPVVPVVALPLPPVVPVTPVLAARTWQAPSLEARDRADERQERERERRDARTDRENSLYERGQDALEQSRWDRAVAAFSEVAALKGSKADAALYWKAYAQNKLGQRADALATIAQLTREFSSSRYQQQAKALEVEVRRDAGQPVRPENENDEDLKLMALQALQNTDPEQAIPMLQKILQGTSSPRVKQRALFVLAQSGSPAARQALVNIAKGNSTPDLQNKAIQYLGTFGSAESRAALADIYQSTQDVDVKRRILRAFMIAGEKSRLLNAAQHEQNPDLREEAVRQLGVMGAHDELWAMYQKETSLDVKKQILQAMFVGGNAPRLIELAKTEPNPELRRVAVRNLGLMGGKETGDALGQIYAANTSNPEIRKAVIQALFIQGNATALVSLARKEGDIEMKKEIVSKLSLMDDKVAVDYLLEILNK